MYPVNQAMQALNLGQPAVSLIQINLDLARMASSPLPCKSLIQYADMWFNLKGDQRFELKVSDEVKWQLYFATAAHRDANGIVQKGAFSADHLRIDDLVLLYRIINSYYLKWDGAEKDVMFQLLFAMEVRFIGLIVQNPQNKHEITQKLINQNDPRLDLIIATLSSNNPAIPRMIENLANWVAEP